jgi:L-histidine N-alpha-methyltransferase
MTTIGLPRPGSQIAEQMASAVSEGLTSRPKWLPAWLFYDDAGSELFNQITELPEYYLTRTERAIFAANAAQIIALAAESHALRIVELGAGSADKTRLLLSAAVDRQDTVIYEPVDVCASALEEAQERI